MTLVFSYVQYDVWEIHVIVSEKNNKNLIGLIADSLLETFSLKWVLVNLVSKTD